MLELQSGDDVSESELRSEEFKKACPSESPEVSLSLDSVFSSERASRVNCMQRSHRQPAKTMVQNSASITLSQVHIAPLPVSMANCGDPLLQDDFLDMLIVAVASTGGSGAAWKSLEQPLVFFKDSKPPLGHKNDVLKTWAEWHIFLP